MDQPSFASPIQKAAHPAGPHVVIIGGGASGVLMAMHLLRRPERAFRVTLIEGRHAFGRGIAYSTSDPDHLLNTRAHNMSAFPEDPLHFVNWLQARPDDPATTADCFVSRGTFGAYLSSLLRPWLDGTDAQRLRVVPQSAVRVEDLARGVVVHLGSGESVIGDTAILATGHVLETRDPDSAILAAWDDPGAHDRDARVIIIGSGLSMVDRVISLLKSGHRGEILSVSRRSLLPRTHAPTTPLPIGIADIPLCAPMSVLVAWVRDLTRKAEAQGGTWRDAVDGIRPHVSRVWRGLPPVERARFLRHAASMWDVHRHRIPPASESTIQAALGSGRLRLLRGSFLGAECRPDGTQTARVLCSASKEVETIPAGLIFDCRGIRRDPARHASPLVSDLLETGRGRVDALSIGLDVDQSCRVIDRTGKASNRLLAIGPASRSAFWEITAIPDIRAQTARLSEAMTMAMI